MAIERTFKLEGFRELERRLAELPKAAGKGVLRRIATSGLEPMADVASAHAPQESGALSFYIGVSEKRTKRAKGASRILYSGGIFRASAAEGIEMAMGPASGGPGVLNYATFVEFGTVDTPAQPYMRPAWDGGKLKLLEHVKDNLGQEITRTAARLAKRRSKAGR